MSVPRLTHPLHVPQLPVPPVPQLPVPHDPVFHAIPAGVPDPKSAATGFPERKS